MKRRTAFLLVLLIVTALWAVFAWPLPRHLTTGVPSSSRSIEKGDVRTMIPGDHLQLMYHFWLVADMLRGETRFMHNLYEFNTGGDDERFVADPYYVPFSLVYAAGEWLGGRAFGWNLAGFVSLLVSFWATWLLLRRYARSDRVALLCALVGVTLPYRWTTLLVGSPTGFATALVPLLFLGIDLSVRDDRPAGGLLAGLTILFAYCSDLHVFFFSVLATPAWCIVAFVTRDDFRWRSGGAWRRLIVALLPTVVFGIIALGISLWLQQSFTGTDIQDGRSLEAVGRYSPARSGLIDYANTGVSNRVFVGHVLPALLGLGFIAEGLMLIRHRRAGAAVLRRALFVVLVAGALVVVTSLALGMHGPWGGRVLIWCRRLIPPYAMIRQPAKVFCLMPTLLSIAVAIAVSALLEPRLGRLRHGIVAVLLGAMVVEHRLQIDPSICLLHDSQGAYAAVVDDAQQRDRTARAVVLPLWPGDSHWSSLYEHYASLYRLRMLNGYSPVIRDDYMTNVVKRFESINQGHITEEQIEALRAMGTHYIVLHEDAFPEKVSPYPVAYTLGGLKQSPHLRLLEQDESVWAFRIVPPLARDRAAGADDALPWFPAWRWEAEHSISTGGVVRAEEQTSRDAFRRLTARGDMVACLTRAPMVCADGLYWLARVRGHGQLTLTQLVDDEPVAASQLVVGSDTWRWRRVNVPEGVPFARRGLVLALADGTCDVDTVFPTAGHWPQLEANESIQLPAALFFHAGYTAAETGGVILRADTDPHGPVFYGPLLPLSPGFYRVTVDAEPVGDDPGVPLGMLALVEDSETAELVPLVGAGPHEATLMRPSNLPLRLELHFTREADLRVTSLTLTRLP